MTYHLTVITFDDEADIAEAVRALRAMAEESQDAEAIRVGPVDREDQEGDVALFLAFPDRDRLRHFLSSPAHDAFLDRYRPHMTKISSVDFDDVGLASFTEVAS
jgi:hypothetical protein